MLREGQRQEESGKETEQNGKGHSIKNKMQYAIFFKPFYLQKVRVVWGYGVANTSE